MKEDIRYCFKNFWSVKDFEKTWYYKALCWLFNPVFDSENPQLTIASIFGQDPLDNNSKAVYIIGESTQHCPSKEYFKKDSILVGHNDFCDIKFNVPFFKDTPNEFYTLLHYIDNPLRAKKKKFCGTLISNGSFTDGFRNNFIRDLDKIITVDNGGHYNNNIGYIVPDGIIPKISFLSEYKFSICMENSLDHNYHTEKLLEGFAANTLPIYYGGDEDYDWLFEVFNKDRFIFVRQGDDLSKVYRHIIDIYNDEDQYTEIMKKPVFNNFSILQGEIDNFYIQMNDIIKNAKSINNNVSI